MDRAYYLETIARLLVQFPVVCLIGPRQVGKTTLARACAQQMGDSNAVHFFDLEKAEDIVMLDNPQLALAHLDGLIVIDEIQHRPDLFKTLRVLVDSRSRNQRWLILGSASGVLLQQSAESLAGRIAYLEIKPFDLSETQELENLWIRGGFPGAYLANSQEDSFEWRRHYIKTYLEQDIPNLGIKIAPLHLRRFWMMIAHYHANLISINEISKSLGLNNKNIKYYLDILTGTFMVRQLQPWWENIGKRQVKSPKIYIRDSGLLHYLLDIKNKETLQRHPKLGASWEGFALESVISALHADAENCFFWSTHHQAELDLLIFMHGKRLGFEFKYSDAPKLTKSMKIAFDNLKLDELTVIYPGSKSYLLTEKISVKPLQLFE